MSADGFAAGLAVGLGRGALIGWTGVGAVACGALSGAVGSLVTDVLKGGKSLCGILKEAVVGAGGLLGGLGSAVGAGLKAGVDALSKALGGAGKAALEGGADELGAVAGGLEGGAREGAGAAADAGTEGAEAADSGIANASERPANPRRHRPKVA